MRIYARRSDLGHAAALRVAQGLVLFMMRPGGQAQFSAHLLAQTADGGRLRGLPAWIVDHLGEELPVSRLAERPSMSERTFARVFHAELGMTPARFVEVARVEAARLLEESELPIKQIARQVGFGDDETMRRAFQRALHVSPAHYQARFRSPLEGPPREERQTPAGADQRRPGQGPLREEPESPPRHYPAAARSG